MRLRFSAKVFCAAVLVTAACSSSRTTGGGSSGSDGDLVGEYMTQQARELASLDHATSRLVDDELLITWDAAELFDFDSAMLRLDCQQKMKPLGEVFLEYPETRILISGHTDTLGAADYKQKLSERRALSVRHFLVAMGVSDSRIEIVGYGDTRPLPDIPAGDARNERVEIRVRANDALRSRAGVVKTGRRRHH